MVDSGPMNDLVIATRGSKLALWQAEHIRDRLAGELGLAAELLGMTTRGDQILDRSLSKVGGKGLFTKEIEEALLDRRADLARAITLVESLRPDDQSRAQAVVLVRSGAGEVVVQVAVPMVVLLVVVMLRGLGQVVVGASLGALLEAVAGEQIGRVTGN